MNSYKAPLNDLSFIFNHLLDQEQLAQLPGLEDLGVDLYESILDEAGKFATNVLDPINASGDREGLKITDGVVTTPKGFKEAYAQYTHAGWNNISLEPEFGGQGLPYILSTAVNEIMMSANKSFVMCSGLTIGAIEAISHAGSDELKQKYLPKLVSGEWGGTMNLTEPGAGSDVGALKTKAIDQGDGTYRIHGQKIFITFGEHDFTDNIIHLVLARLPDAPEGVRGISLFLVPKFMVNDDGSLGERNDLRCVSIEHKLGIHASPTCVMAYGDNEGALGYLVGEKNKGLMAMFVMMNMARLTVGMEGVALTERSYQAALDYARERVQGVDAETGQSVAIIEHADVRRQLLQMKSNVEAMRALSLFIAQAQDISFRHADAEVRQHNQGLVDLLIPVFKAWATETALKTTTIGIQVHGGLGFIEETGVAQYLRDAVISVIYEGTTAIQAADLVGRKVVKDQGKNLSVLIGLMKQTLAQAEANADLADIAFELKYAIELLEQHSRAIAGQFMQSTKQALSVSVPYLMLTGLVTGAWQLAQSALKASELLAAGDSNVNFLKGKIETARFYHKAVLPEIRGLAYTVSNTGSVITGFDNAYFGE
ncbi:acyl-CoA dehydrogenase [Acinetobacter sp. ANC 3813]|uniref:acyl-CoA dehydrogenase n=1 Tax=Acinetobacter sp. ANC 3813 TaxID=1977873 RepID=UPI000A3481B7|nr:acyl-CoA dehydrogenase [Acinetobacter sp. ANC 3813]OTG90781.1 acyl-CoA dehydrogenase [Acinetobacter sp. ANC 3813]